MDILMLVLSDMIAQAGGLEARYFKGNGNRSHGYRLN